MFGAPGPKSEEDIAMRLFAAARDGKSSDLISLLESSMPNPPIGEQEWEVGLTPLHVAVMGGHLDCADILLHYGADINAADQLGGRPIHVATLIGKAPCLRLLLRKGADMNAVPNLALWSCLHLAVEAGRADCLEELLADGADVRVTNRHRQTALDVALAKANRYGAALLLAYGSPLPSDPQRAVEPGLLGFALQVAERRAGRLTAGRVAEEQRRVAAWLAGGEGVETSKAAGESSSETSANGGGGGACGGGGASSSSHGDDDAGAASSGDVGSGGGAASPRSPEAKWREAFADADAAEWGGGAAAAWGWECPLGPRCPMLRHRGQGQSSSASCSTSGRAPGGCGGRRCDSPRARFAAALRGVLSAGPNRDPAGAAGAARALAGFAAAARAGAFDEAAKALRAAVGEQPWGEASGAEQKAALIAVLRCVAAVEAERRARDADAVATAAAAAARAAAGGVLARLRAAHLRLPAADEGERGRSSRGNAEEELGGDPPQQHHHRMDAAAGAAAGDDSAQDDGGSSAAAPQAS